MPGEILQQLRDKAGLTQTELAAKSNLSLSQIQKMEAATTMRGRRSTWRKAVEAVGGTLELFDRGQEPSLPDDLLAQLATQAAQEGVTVADLIRAGSMALAALSKGRRDLIIGDVTRRRPPGQRKAALDREPGGE